MTREQAEMLKRAKAHDDDLRKHRDGTRSYRDPSRYGRRYWCVKVPSCVSLNREIYCHGDECVVGPSGELSITRLRGDGTTETTLSLASGSWWAAYAASCMDGHAVAVERWPEEVSSPDGTTGFYSYSEDQPTVRAKARNGVGPSVRFVVMQRDGFKCRCCGADGTEARLEIDHIVPVAKGGSDDLENLQVLCFRCNRGKGTKAMNGHDEVPE